jgi:hypothetical protein
MFPVFQVGVFNSVGYNAFAGVTPLNAGGYVAAYRNGTAHISSNGIVKVVRSTDGLNWSQVSTIRAAGDIDTRDPSPLIDIPGVGLLSGYFDYTGSVIGGARYRISADSGNTWGSEQTVALPTGYTWHILWGRPVRIGSTTYFSGYGLNTASGHQDSLFWSFNGTTWTLLGVIAVGAASGTQDYTETAVYSADGVNWRAMVREDNTLALREYTSSNGGVTWAAVESQVQFTQGLSPWLLPLANGDLVLGNGRRNGECYIEFRKSSDGGVTWSNPFRIWANSGSADLGYPAFVQRTDGLVCGLFYTTNGVLRAFQFDPVQLLRQPWLEDFETCSVGNSTVSGMLGRVDNNSGIASVVSTPVASGSRAVYINDIDNSVLGFRKIINGGSTGSVTFQWRIAAEPNGPKFSLQNAAGLEVFLFITFAAASGKLRYYNGTAYVDLPTPTTLSLDTWYTINLAWDTTGSGTCGVSVNGVSCGNAIKYAGRSGPIRYLQFQSGSGGGTGDQFYIDNLSQP